MDGSLIFPLLSHEPHPSVTWSGSEVGHRWSVVSGRGVGGEGRGSAGTGCQGVRSPRMRQTRTAAIEVATEKAARAIFIAGRHSLWRLNGGAPETFS